MTSTKLCIYCNQDKPYDYEFKGNVRLGGFHGSKCRDCYYEGQRAKTEGLRAKVKAHDARRLALKAEELGLSTKPEEEMTFKERFNYLALTDPKEYAKQFKKLSLAERMTVLSNEPKSPPA